MPLRSIAQGAAALEARCALIACAPIACASIASAVCLTKLRVPIPAAHSASAYLVRVRVKVRVRVRARARVQVRVRGRVRVSASSYLIVRRKLQWGAGLLACAQRAAGRLAAELLRAGL